MALLSYLVTDKLCLALDNLVRTVFAKPMATNTDPASALDEPILSDEEKCLAASLMRVNHCGEVCAQALYCGQALTAQSSAVRKQLQQAASEESDHLNWCAMRLQQLDSHQSYFNLLFYSASLTLGALTGAIGDAWSLGFVEETERQVEQHLSRYLQKLPQADYKSRLIVQKMREDEIKHCHMAKKAGAREIPVAFKKMMRVCALIMIRTTYWI